MTTKPDSPIDLGALQAEVEAAREDHRNASRAFRDARAQVNQADIRLERALKALNDAVAKLNATP